MADDADREAERAARAEEPRIKPVPSFTYFECFPMRRARDAALLPTKVVMATHLDRWTSIGWSLVERTGAKATIEWRGKGTAAVPPGRPSR